MNGKNEQDLIRKITALLAKAEGTDNEHEAAAFFEKAQELMVTHAIEEARVRAAILEREGRKVESPVQVDFMYATNDAHAKGKIALVRSVAAAHHVKVVQYKASTWTTSWFARRNGVESNKYAQWCILVGYASDIENVKVLYTSLLIQWARFVRADVKASGYSKREEFGFRTGHLVGFARRINERLDEVSRRVVAAADANALMVNKDAEVEAAWKKAMGIHDYCHAIGTPKGKRTPRWCTLDKDHDGEHAFTGEFSSGRGSRSREVDYNGYYAGKAAADRADIGLTQVGNTSKQIQG